MGRGSPAVDPGGGRRHRRLKDDRGDNHSIIIVGIIVNFAVVDVKVLVLVDVTFDGWSGLAVLRNPGASGP
jgi:hypothetical protein